MREELIVLQEELGELAMAALEMQQRVSKLVRFEKIMDEESRKNNIERIQSEWADVVSIIVMLNKHGLELVPSDKVLMEKIARVSKYL